jgi:3-oxoacyl-[acyl-carrier-protein] synthase III
MAESSISGVRLAGVSAAVPSARAGVESYVGVFGEEESAKISATVGVRERRIAPPDMTTADLCLAAGERLLADLGWEKSSVEGVVFVTQTPDYLLPATACSLQERLGLPKSCVAFDVNLGCSGFTHGLWMAASLIRGAGLRRVLVLAGDTISRIAAPEDRSVAPLFGDAGSAGAMEAAADAPPTHFVLGSDGSGERKLMVKCGGFRNPRTAESARREAREGGNIRSDEDLYMEGAEIFAFTLREIPGLVEQTLKLAGKSLEEIDHVVCHQANKFMLQHLAKRMKIPAAKFTLGLEKYGNTSSASIPLALVTELREAITDGKELLLAGFGVGFSWSAAQFRSNGLRVSELVEIG